MYNKFVRHGKFSIFFLVLYTFLWLFMGFLNLTGFERHILGNEIWEIEVGNRNQ